MTYNITLTANHQSLTAEHLPLAAESVQYLTAKVVCETEDWTGREIKAMFGQGCTVYEVPVTGGEITAKQQLNLTAGDWCVWLVGNSARDGDVIPRITTNVAHISVAPTGSTEGNPFPAIPPTVEEQLRADMGNLADLTTEDKSSLVAAINEVRQTGGGPEGPNEISTDTATALNGLLKGNGSTVQVAERGVDYVQPDDIMQSDWNQNDSTQPDYVKNRPFYTGDPVETVLVEESTVSFSFSENEGIYMGRLESTFSATVGETYKVYWDGAVYECVCVNLHDVPSIGNLSIIGDGSDTGEPFVMGILRGKEIRIFTADTSASHTVSISATVVPVVKIDPKYIRDMYYTGDPVETVFVEESTVLFSFNENEGLYIGGLKSTFSATVGETYKVSWDGAAYECACADFSGKAAIGNLSIAGAGSDTGEPFVMIVNNGRSIAIGTADTSASHTISISRFAPEVVKIDPKYIRDMYYTGNPVETVLVEESTVSFAENQGLYMAQIRSSFEATVGETYKVSWDGAVYECVCVNLHDVPSIGNLSIIGDGSDTGEPFVMGILRGKEIRIFTADTSASHTVSISATVVPVVKIDPKYLPDNVATKADVEAVQTAANNARATANNARATANNAQTTANNAQTTANNAQTTANNAQTTANNAKSEALDLAARMFGHTSVVDSAFYHDKTLSITSLPACIESIGANAFNGCPNLALTSLPSGITSIGVNAFQGCKKLALTSLPSGLTSISDYAFYECTNLALTSLPSGLTSIGDYAFIGCTGLALTSLPSGLTSIGDHAFANCPNLALTSLPSGLTSIGGYAFDRCTNLALTSLPSGLTSISDYAFIDCTNLALTSLPSGLTSIGGYAFDRCTNLALTSLPSGLTSIGDCAFATCTNLALTSLPSGLTSISARAFAGCPNLALTSLPSGITSIGVNAFQGCKKLALTSLPSGLTSISDYAFYECTNLALTSLPSGLTSIGDYAFIGCTGLALTSLPSGLTSIGSAAFDRCTNLALTSLPSGLTSIGSAAFQGCTGLTSITFTGKPTRIANNVFSGCTNLTTINVPWAEGEVANSPWGATNATINYNYTEA